MFDRHMNRQRLRPTFLLQLVAALASIGLFTAAVALLGRGISAWALIGLLLLWLVGLELGLLPLLLEWTAVRRAETSDSALRSAWFTYDPGEVDEQARDRQRRDTQHNPTLW